MRDSEILLLASVIIAGGCLYLGYNIGNLAQEASEANGSIGGALGRFGLA